MPRIKKSGSLFVQFQFPRLSRDNKDIVSAAVANHFIVIMDFTKKIIVSFSINGHCRQRISRNKAKKPILTLFSSQPFTTASLLFKLKLLLVHFVCYLRISQCQILSGLNPPT